MQSYIFWALLGMDSPRCSPSSPSGIAKFPISWCSRSRPPSCRSSSSPSSPSAASWPLIYDLEKGTLAWAIAGGVALTVAVTSLFHALSLGVANVVVPIYGMFIVGGSLLGVLFLGESMTWNKIVGLAAVVIGVVLISI